MEDGEDVGLCFQNVREAFYITNHGVVGATLAKYVVS